MTNQKLASTLLELLGGKANVISATSCMTRLRVQLSDVTRADIAAIKATEGVLGIVEGDALQIILGPGKARKVTDLFVAQLGQQEVSNSCSGA